MYHFIIDSYCSKLIVATSSKILDSERFEKVNDLEDQSRSPVNDYMYIQQITYDLLLLFCISILYHF